MIDKELLVRELGVTVDGISFMHACKRALYQECRDCDMNIGDSCNPLTEWITAHKNLRGLL